MTEPDVVVCPGCGQGGVPDSAFCTSCGRPLAAAPGSSGDWRDTKQFFWAFGVIALYILSSHAVDIWVDPQAVLAFDAGFLLLVVGTAVVFGRSFGGALRPRPISIDRMLTYALIQAVITYGVHLTGPWLSAALELEEMSYTAVFLDTPYPLLLSLLSTAVFPALTEELAFRGLLFGQLQKLAGVTSAIIVTGILFATVHFAMLTMYWLLPVGLLYGWIRAREGHIWWGVLLHGLHNATVVFLELR